jgi:hypothetical protein
VCSKAIASETEVLPFMDEVQIPADDYSFKDCSLHQMSVNTAIVNGDYDNIAVTDYKVEERSVSHAEKISAGSIQILENESMLDATDRSTRTGKCNGLSKEISSSWKSQNSKQSRFLFARSEGSIERSSHYSTPNFSSSRQLQREWANGKDVLESTNEHDELNINRPSNDAFTPNMQGFQSISEGRTFFIPSEAIEKLKSSMMLQILHSNLVDFVYLHQQLRSLCLYQLLQVN